MTTITLPRAVVEQALEALQAYGSHVPNCDHLVLLTSLPPQRKPCSCGLRANITLRAALAQQAEPVEPVAWIESPHGVIRANPSYKFTFPSQLLHWRIPLYTAPPQRKPLTEEEAAKACGASGNLGPLMQIVRAVERAHGIGEGERC